MDGEEKKKKKVINQIMITLQDQSLSKGSGMQEMAVGEFW